MIVMKKSIPNNYTYENLLEDFKIDINIFHRFNDTASAGNKKRLDELLSGKRNGNFKIEKKNIKGIFEAVLYLRNNDENLEQMDLIYDGEYIFKSVTAQTFIFVTGMIINMKYNTHYNYSTINEFYKWIRERKDSRGWRYQFDIILKQLKEVV